MILCHPGVAWRKHIRANGRSQADVAAAVGISQKHLSQLVHCKVLPSAALVLRLSHELGQNPDRMWLEQAMYELNEARKA